MRFPIVFAPSFFVGWASATCSFRRAATNKESKRTTEAQRTPREEHREIEKSGGWKIEDRGWRIEN